MNLGTGELIGLVSGLGIALSIISKLTDFVLSTIARRINPNASHVTNGAMQEVAAALRDVATGQAELTKRLERLCDLATDIKSAQLSHEAAEERRFEGLHRRLDMKKEG